jgi:superfamily II DNA or RNA helicase
MSAWDDGPFLLSAAPGAGKTIPSLVFARRLLSKGIVRRVHVICPTTPLTRQWAEAAARLGVQLVPDAMQLRPPRDFHGVVATYARAASSAARWAEQCGEQTLVIADEAHHLGEELAWGEGFARAFGATRRWLLLSGTTFRSDQSPIAGVRYDGGVAVPDVSYTYAEAVRDGICRPVAFIPYDGTLSWRSGAEVVESSFDDVDLTGREAGRRYRTAISTELTDGLPRILRAAHDRLNEVRLGGHSDAGGLVVSADGAHARRVAAALKEITGRAPTVVLHTDARAAGKLRAFAAGRERWLVAVNMVSEGVDIPRLRVGVYATPAKTPLMFRQIVGRFVRIRGGGGPVEHSYLFLPADRLLRAHAAEVEVELRHVLPPAAEAPPEQFDVVERRRSEPSEQEAFVPLNADVAPQLALVRRRPAAAEPAGVVRAARNRVRRPARRRPARGPTGLQAPSRPARQAPRPRAYARRHAEPLLSRDQHVAEPCDGGRRRQQRLDRADRSLDRPPACRAAARQPTAGELSGAIMGRLGLEPRTTSLKGSCSTD